MLQLLALLASSSALGAEPVVARQPAHGSVHASSEVLFEPNGGRWPAEARFHARANAVDAWLCNDGWWLALGVDREHAVALRMTFAAGAASEPAGADFAQTRFNYLIGNDPQRWSCAVRAARRVTWSGVAPGIDVVMRAADGAFEYDLLIAPGADPRALSLRVAGHTRLALAADGALEIETAHGTLRQPPPLAWELDLSGARRELECRYRVLDDATFSFSTPAHDPRYAAVIDPALRWATYLSGGASQTIEALALAPNGSVVVAGQTDALDFPTTPGAYDPGYHGLVEAFVSCLSNDGQQLLWSTFIGGANDDVARAVALDSNGAVVVGGDTQSSNFPTHAGGFDTSWGGPRDGFLLRLSAQGDALEWATFVGGSNADVLYALALDAHDDVVAVGSTQGGTFPTTLGAFDRTYNGGAGAGDAFVAKVSSDGTQLVWSTYLGGGANELATCVALDASGAAVLSGHTFGASFPVSAGAFDSSYSAPSEPFVARLDALGAVLDFATFFGVDGEQEIRALALRPGAEVVCAGSTNSGAFPTSANAVDTLFAGATEGFVAELSANGTQLAHATFWGGVEDDSVNALALEPGGVLVIGGETLSNDMLTTPGAYSRVLNALASAPTYDAFVARLASDLSSAHYATYYGSAYDESLTALALDGAGEAVFAGTTHGANLPTSATAFQPTWNVLASQEGFVGQLAFWLHPINFGVAKLNSFGAGANLIWTGFPSVADQHFAVGVDFAMPLSWTAPFYSAQLVNWPFQGGRLRPKPPLQRVPRFKTDTFGYGMRAVSLTPALSGQTLYFQAWYDDDGDPYGGCLTDSLRVIVYP